MSPLQRETENHPSTVPQYLNPQQALNSRSSFWRTNSTKGLKGNSWSKRASMGTRAAAFSSPDRAEGNVGAHKLGGNLLKDISRYTFHFTQQMLTQRTSCSFNRLLKTTHTWWSGGRVGDSSYNTLSENTWIPVQRRRNDGMPVQLLCIMK